jgi:acetyltransferase-like isoleucine patch superfamily enzyme
MKTEERHGPTRSVVMFGIGNMSEMLTTYLEKFSDMTVVAYTVDKSFLTVPEFCDRPVVAWEDLEQQYPSDEVELIGPFGFQNVNRFRQDRYLDGKRRGYRYASFIHPHSMVYTEDMGEHVVILENTVVQPHAKIGNNVMILSCSHVAHHVQLKDHCFISSMVGVAGGTIIGEAAHLAGGGGIGHNLTIGARSVVLNNAFISTDLDEESVVVGPRPDLKPYKSSRVAKKL